MDTSIRYVVLGRSMFQFYEYEDFLGSSTLEDAVKAIDPPLNDTLLHPWMAALLVTVPLCPLYNPGNPRQAAALLVVARQGNGAGQSAAAGTAAPLQR